MAQFSSLIPFGRSGLSRRGEFNPFGSFRDEMDRLFEDFGTTWPSDGRQGFMLPKTDVAESESGLELITDLPGFDDKDITLDIQDGVLTVKAERKDVREEKDPKKHYHLVERREGSYLRRFTLPFEADAAKAKAHLEKGVLTVTVPRLATAERKPTRIPLA